VDFTRRFASIAQALEALSDETVIDGEIIAYGAGWATSFNVLQNHRGAGAELHLYVFDSISSPTVYFSATDATSPRAPLAAADLLWASSPCQAQPSQSP
jgi:ATP-dependent DNA ligase